MHALQTWGKSSRAAPSPTSQVQQRTHIASVQAAYAHVHCMTPTHMRSLSQAAVHVRMWWLAPRLSQEKGGRGETKYMLCAVRVSIASIQAIGGLQGWRCTVDQMRPPQPSPPTIYTALLAPSPLPTSFISRFLHLCFVVHGDDDFSRRVRVSGSDVYA